MKAAYHRRGGQRGFAMFACAIKVQLGCASNCNKNNLLEWDTLGVALMRASLSLRRLHVLFFYFWIATKGWGQVGGLKHLSGRKGPAGRGALLQHVTHGTRSCTPVVRVPRLHHLSQHNLGVDKAGYFA